MPFFVATGCGDAGRGGCWGSAALSFQPPYRPNVLLITLDAQRADHLGPYGYKAVRTPAIDGLASRGVVFEDVVSAATWTQPSVAAMLTGRWPARLSISRAGDTTQSLGADETTLAEVLEAAGYATGAFVDNGTLAPEFGYAQGFDEYHNVLADDGEAITRPAIEWLAGVSGRPLFCWLHFLDPHAPYRFRDFPPYAPADDPRRAEATVLPLPDQMTKSLGPRLARHYDSDMTFADACIGLVLDELRRRGEFDRTLVVVSADHGESLGELHGYERAFGHGDPPWEEQIHIPLIVSWPGIVAEGLRVSGQRSNVDILPTVCSLLGLAAPRDVDGTDLLPALSGGTPPASVPAFSQAFASPSDSPDDMRLAIRTDRVKLFAGLDRQIKEHFLRSPGVRDFEIVRRGGLPEGEFDRLAPLLQDYVDLYARGATRPSDEVLERLKAMGYVTGKDAVGSD